MIIIFISIAAFASTFLGGLFALRFKDKLHLILGFSAGAVLGVAFFDLLPESIGLADGRYTIPAITALVAFGFAAYMVLDRLAILSCGVPDNHDDGHGHHHRGTLGAASLSLHSFLDGAAIGLAFQVSSAVGAIVTVAVLVHDFSDGINTVNLVLKDEGEKRHAFRWLLVDAVAPVLGATSTLFFSVPGQALGVILALFTGFFLYIGASELLPESHHAHPTKLTTGMTLLGMAVLYIAIHIAH
ncbi:MAG: ZIP family metal transporter [Candidatus Paceibacterota bacterium]|jgi:ZIP family zinc transporter